MTKKNTTAKLPLRTPNKHHIKTQFHVNVWTSRKNTKNQPRTHRPPYKNTFKKTKPNSDEWQGNKNMKKCHINLNMKAVGMIVQL